ncbi:hypothetical protein B5V03_02030 [Bradyrhizobium betae]|uniref:FAD-binding domain-containing protein n=2 Tax=Bradyrhizobium betae TaxID=244734 RepID=A0A4Q1VRZ8_9BRAD|nr:hypothetical protein B5V03_02030 [Bradyrhizobium betae]
MTSVEKQPVEFDVIVAGAGPVGLTLAIDLGRRGVRCLLMERQPSTGPWPKMDRSNARTMEFFRRMGIAERVRALGYPDDVPMDVFVITRLVDPPLAHLKYPSVGEYRKAIAECTDGSQPLEPYQLVSQNKLEPLLREVAEATPNVTVRYGLELLSFEQDADSVRVKARCLDGGEEVHTARYLVGSDGGASAVRKQLDIKLQGTGGIRSMRQVCFRSEELFDRIPIGKGRHYYVADELGSTLIVQGDRKEFTLHSGLPEGTDFREAILDVVGFPFEFEILNVTNWTLHLLVAERYREKRVCLAGDSAHLVIPTGGLGMNSGVGDALDLSWKLAGTIAGWGGEQLLASYEYERRLVGLKNRDSSGWAAAGQLEWRKWWRSEIRDDSARGAEVRATLGRAAQHHHARIYAMVGVELGYSYAGSPLIRSEPGSLPDWTVTTYTPHTTPGVRIPHMWLKDGRALQDVLGQNYTILDLRADSDVSDLQSEFASINAPLDVVRLDEPHVREVFGASLFLLRPDLHIVWRGSKPPVGVDARALCALATGNVSTFEVEHLRAMTPENAAKPFGAQPTALRRA